MFYKGVSAESFKRAREWGFLNYMSLEEKLNYWEKVRDNSSHWRTSMGDTYYTGPRGGVYRLSSTGRSKVYV